MNRVLTGFHAAVNKVGLPAGAFSIELPPGIDPRLAHEQGAPMVEVCPPRIDATAFFDVLTQIAGIARAFNPRLDSDINCIMAALPSTRAERDLFVSRVLTPSADTWLGHAQDASAELFSMLVGNTVRVFTVGFAHAVHTFHDPDSWLRGTCPICGRKPLLAHIEPATNRRYLYCGVCSSKWRFQRWGCPYCLSDRFDFYAVEGMDRYRVYVCDHCHGYLKAFDGQLDERGTLDVFQDNLDTLQLDILAMREGYSN